MREVLHPFNIQDHGFPGERLRPTHMSLRSLQWNERETYLALQSQKAYTCQFRFAYLWYWDLQGRLDYQVLNLT